MFYISDLFRLDCYQSKCVQKYAYHRLLIYNPKDYYYPFKVESFRLPSSCDCVTSAFEYRKVRKEKLRGFSILGSYFLFF